MGKNKQPKPTPPTTTIRLYPALDLALQRLAKKEKRTRHWMILHGLSVYCAWRGELAATGQEDDAA